MAKNPLYNNARMKDILATQAAMQEMEVKDHAHECEEIMGLQEQLDGKSALGHGHGIGDISGLTAALAGKAPLVHSHAIADIATLQAQLQAIPVLRHNGSVVAEPKIFTASQAIVGTAGAVVFSMVDGAGAALIGTLRYAKAEVSDNTVSYNYAYALSPDKKQLTVTVYRLQSVTLLGIQVLTTAVAAPAGTIVNLLAIA